MIQFDPGGRFAADLKRKVIDVLAYLENFADTTVLPGLEVVGDVAGQKAIELTPKDRDPRDVDDPPYTPQISDSWVTETNKAARRVTLHNIHPRDDVVAILEYGSPPHDIEAHDPANRPLRFTDRSLRDRIENKVRHPGHRPFGMIAGATAVANIEMTALTQRLQAMIDQTWIAGVKVTAIASRRP